MWHTRHPQVTQTGFNRRIKQHYRLVPLKTETNNEFKAQIAEKPYYCDGEGNFSKRILKFTNFERKESCHLIDDYTAKQKFNQLQREPLAIDAKLFRSFTNFCEKTTCSALTTVQTLQNSFTVTFPADHSAVECCQFVSSASWQIKFVQCLLEVVVL